MPKWYYQWDGEVDTYVDPASGTNVWDRDDNNGIIHPIIDGDGISVKNSSGTATVTLDAATGTVEANNCRSSR